jgi:hypothetical protein
MKQFIFFLTLMLGVQFQASSQTLQSQTCVKVDTVYTTAKIKELKNRRITFGISQIAEEELSNKYQICQEGEPIGIEVAYVGTPKKSFTFGGVGGAVQTTEVLIKIHMAGLIYTGNGAEETSAQMMFIQLNDDQIPFDKTTLSTALKKAIADAVKKMPTTKPIEGN